MTKVFLKTSLIGLTAILASSCGGDSSNGGGGTPDAGGVGGAGATNDGTGNAGTANGGNMSGTGGGTAGGSSGGGTGATGGSMNAGECAAAQEMPAEVTCDLDSPDCTTTMLDGVSNGPELGLDGAALAYFYGDGCSTICRGASDPGQICISGIADDAQSDYSHWGTGIGIQMAETDADGNLVMAFDATDMALSAAVAGVRFNLTGVTSTAPIRVQMTMVNDGAPASSIDFEENSFVIGKDAMNDITEDGVVTVWFDELMLPSWTKLDLMCDGETDDAAFDPSRIHSLQFQVVTAPGASRPYDFCVDTIEWIDADENVVDLPQVTPPGGQTQEQMDGGAGAGTPDAGTGNTQETDASTSGTPGSEAGVPMEAGAVDTMDAGAPDAG